ncbi:hypothetical protein NKG94_19930 [Micromonospora sp. M12]
MGVDLEMAAGTAAPTWCTATPGTRTWPVTPRSCCTGAARGDRAQPGAAAAVEGRAARRRLRARPGSSAPRWRPPTR